MNTTRRSACSRAAAALLLLAGSNASAQVHSPGNGVTSPRVVRQATPLPRPASSVIVECVVSADGTLTDETVVRSSTPEDDEAVLKAVATWTFEPGRKDGEPVAVRFYISVAPRSR